jgi:WD40 repeat protein
MSGYVFISYAREDRSYVQKLAAHLDEHGIPYWYDDHINPGSRFDREILQKIEQCAAFVVVMTPAANESDWVMDELDYAKAKDRELVPILLEGDRFFGLGHIQVEILTNSELPSPRFVHVLKRLIGEGDLRFEMKAHDGHVRSVAYPVSESSMVASAGPEMCVRIWNPANGELRRAIRGATWPVAFTRFGEVIATGGKEHTAYLWDTETGKLIKQVGKHKDALVSIAISPDGKTLVTGAGGRDKTECVWDIETGALRHTLGGKRVEPASPLVLSPDGTWLVAPTDTTNRASLWKVETGKFMGSLSGHYRPVRDVTVSWDGRYIATGSDDNTAKIWDAKTGDELHTLGLHRMPVRAVAFSRSGYRLATGSTDQTIRLWDTANGAHIRCITQRAGGIYDLAYSPDGRTLASGHGDGAIRIWTA